MKLKERISWLMGAIQHSLFPYLDENLPSPLAEPEKRLVKILELIQIEQYIPLSRQYQWTGRPIKEREAIARAFIAKSLLRYQHTSSLHNALLSTPNLRIICGDGGGRRGRRGRRGRSGTEGTSWDGGDVLGRRGRWTEGTFLLDCFYSIMLCSMTCQDFLDSISPISFIMSLCVE